MKQIILTLAVIAASMAHAGNEAGGGGSGIFCPPNGNTPIPARVLDLYEGSILQGLNPIESSSEYEDQILGVVQKLGFDFRIQTDFYLTYKKIKASTVFLPPGVRLTSPSDLGNNNVTVIPSGCHLETIGYYDSNGRLLVSTDAFNELTETGKAAFFTHESLYKMRRAMTANYIQSQNSGEVRPLVPLLFALDAMSIGQHASLFNTTVSWGAYFGGLLSGPWNHIPTSPLLAYRNAPVPWNGINSPVSTFASNWYPEYLPRLYVTDLEEESFHFERAFYQLSQKGRALTVQINNPLQRQLDIRFRCLQRDSFNHDRLVQNQYPGMYQIPRTRISDYQSSDTSAAVVLEKTTLTDAQYSKTFTLPTNCERLQGGFSYPYVSFGDTLVSPPLAESAQIFYDGIQIATWPKYPLDFNTFYGFGFNALLYYKSDLPQ